MCGLAGLLGPYSAEEIRAAATRMADSLQHRGPDDEGVWLCSDSPLALAHRRLSIQDLSSLGHQPMVSNSGRMVIAFNGEIYNFKKLADELSDLGVTLKGGSDTAVILAAIECWGMNKALSKSEGMFAFALVDVANRTITLARDRFGEKPLFYGWLGNTFLFASELKAIIAALGRRPDIDYTAMAAYLRFGYVPSPHSIFKNIYKLVPGSSLTINFDQFNFPELFSAMPQSNPTMVCPELYWDFDEVISDAQSNIITDEREAIEELHSTLKECVKDQCIADVPIGAFLSGGIDSTLIAAVMQSVNSLPINTFTIGFKEKYFDEAPFASAISKHLGTNHHEFYVGEKDCLQLVSDLPKVWDEPFADSSQLPALLVTRMAKKHVTVCLTGDGGDELFCGYNRYLVGNWWADRTKYIPSGMKSIGASAISSVPFHVWEGLYDLYTKLSSKKATQANFAAKVQKVAGLLKADNSLEAYRFLLSYWDAPSDVTRSAEAKSILDYPCPVKLPDFLRVMMYWDQKGYLVDDNLVKNDRASMSVALESRLPLLNHRIAELSWRLPPSMLVRNRKTKWILRAVLDKYVPSNLIDRPKMGFSVPLASWLRGPLKDWSLDMLASADSIFPRASIESIERTWKEHDTNRYDHSNKLWSILMLIAWYKNPFN